MIFETLFSGLLNASEKDINEFNMQNIQDREETTIEQKVAPAPVQDNVKAARFNDYANQQSQKGDIDFTDGKISDAEVEKYVTNNTDVEKILGYTVRHTRIHELEYDAADLAKEGKNVMVLVYMNKNHVMARYNALVAKEWAGYFEDDIEFLVCEAKTMKELKYIHERSQSTLGRNEVAYNSLPSIGFYYTNDVLDVNDTYRKPDDVIGGAPRNTPEARKWLRNGIEQIKSNLEPNGEYVYRSFSTGAKMKREY